MDHDYSIYLRDELNEISDWDSLQNWDFFISAFNQSERIREAYNKVKAVEKLWVIQEEYNLLDGELPPENKFHSTAKDESSFCKELVAKLDSAYSFNPEVHSLCIDITGFTRPNLLFLVLLLKNIGVKRFDALYAEPLQYKSKENTSFSTGFMAGVRPVHGFEGSPAFGSNHDFLILGMGYDDRLLASVAEHKEKADKHQLFGLPSLRADMYQESVIRSRLVADELGDPDFAISNRSFAPANDPFGTASSLAEIVAKRKSAFPHDKIILSPLGTKAQVLGFALYYILECNEFPASIIFPFSSGYAAETSTGLARAWRYKLEFE